ncbi:MAG: hypothetical protein U0414_00990 [Polyangiaceae bacterium]
MRLLLPTILALGATACPAPADDDGPPTKCPGLYVGDVSAAPELEIVYLDAANATQDLGDGRIPLVFPPQGGRVLFVGARAKNVDPCGVLLTGAIRDPVSKKLQLDKRTVNLVPTADGWGESAEGDTASFANVPACPNQWAESDLFDAPFELTVALEDARGKTAMKTATITPFCGEPANEAQCRCICKKGYVLGEMCAAP